MTSWRRPAAVAVALLAIAAATACSTSVQAGHAVPAHVVLGRPGCHPASPTDVSNTGGREMEGTGHAAQWWGLLFYPGTGPRVGPQEKIAWRMTGTGPIQLLAISPSGVAHRAAWGPEPHGGSNWTRPGREWGAGYVFTSPGCWDLRARRGHATADAWVQVVS